MAKCECGLEMLRANGCRFKRIKIPAENKSFNRIKMGDPGDWYEQYIGTPEQDSIRCCDCGAKIGHYHHSGCDIEICPICKGQLLSCSCFDSQNEVILSI